MTWILLTLALAWGILAWRKPKFAVLVFPILLPAYLLRAKLGPLPTTLLELCWFTTLLGVTLKQGWSIWRGGLAKSRTWLWPVLAWIVATLIAVIVAPNHLAALGLWRAYILEPVVFFILLNGFLDEKNRTIVFKAFAAGAIFIASWSIYQFVTGQSIPHPWDTDLLTRRATGPFPFPNAVSLFCAPLAALFFGLAFGAIRRPERSEAQQMILWLGFLSATLATLLAKSVGGTLAIGISVAACLLWKKKTRLPTIGAILLGIIILFSVPQLRSPTLKTLSFQGWSGRVRVWMWQETFDMLKDRPIFGAGFGAYPEIFKPYHKKTFIEIFQYPHNIVLNLWSETGLLGLLAFTWICFTWLRLTRRHNLIFALPLLAILIQGLVDVPYFKNDLAFMFWILAALAAVANPETGKDKLI
ncbi:O-antigen ligase family protein [Candidatus Uhrbacteria bacterium]|nr:O-antigen ligase family protein [Candidatus Uhrbacteria bacterium]